MIYNIYNYFFCKKQDVNQDEIKLKRLKILPLYHKLLHNK